MNEPDGQVLLVVLILGEDAIEVDDWETVALHEERLPDRQSMSWLRNEKREVTL